MVQRTARRLARQVLEDQRWLLRLMPEGVRAKVVVPAVGKVRWGDLRTLQPIDTKFGFSRGTVIDRYYIEQFLDEHRADIRGRVLEIGDSTYTRRFGGDRVEQEDVLHYVEGNPHATFVGDLSTGEGLPSDTFDCIILTQTLQMIYDAGAAVRTIHRILRPGGVVLMTGHGTSMVARHLEDDDWGEYWRFTRLSGRLLFADAFGTENVEAKAYGNVLTCVAFLHGLAAEELSPAEMNHRDHKYEVLVAVRARKALAHTGGDAHGEHG